MRQTTVGFEKFKKQAVMPGLAKKTRLSEYIDAACFHGADDFYQFKNGLVYQQPLPKLIVYDEKKIAFSFGSKVR